MLKQRWVVPSIVFLLLCLMFAEMTGSVHSESVTWDEGDHLFAGFMSLHTHDFGYNPEHPPLAKMVAALPLLPLQLRIAPDTHEFFKDNAYFGGHDLLFRNSPRFTGQQLIFRARLAMMVFPLTLGLLLFFAGRELFDTATGLLALALLATEPNILTHGPLVTTDTAVSCFFVALVWTAFRYAERPTVPRLLLAGLAAGGALGAKHSGLVLVATIAPLFLGETIWKIFRKRRVAHASDNWPHNLSTFGGGYLAIVLLGTVVLWAVYGFRYAARPAGLPLGTGLANYVAGLHPAEAKAIVLVGRLHLLPESWLFGLADVRLVANAMPTYFLGQVYAHGLWRYFPILLLIKLTVGTLVLVILAVYSGLRDLLPRGRALTYTVVPAALYFLVAMGSGLNLGVRHVLPCIPFLLLFAAAGTVALARQSRVWALIVTVLVAAHIASSARTYPLYLSYSNEAWGGPSHTARYLSDSNVDWGQQLLHVSSWLAAQPIPIRTQPCAFAYFVTPFLLPADYGIPCRPLPTFDTSYEAPLDGPQTFTGTLLISAADLNGFEWGTRIRNPYQGLINCTPDAVIDNGVFVFHGTFDLRAAAAIAYNTRAGDALRAGKPAQAAAHARLALAIDPGNFDALYNLGQALAATHDIAGAFAAFHQGLNRTAEMEPSAQSMWRSQIVSELKKLS